MNAKEALETINRLGISARGYMNLKEAINIAIISLDKQIPKKPKKYMAFDGIERNGCPSCAKNEILYAGQKYCSVCGQAIDWCEVER